MGGSITGITISTVTGIIVDRQLNTIGYSVISPVTCLTSYLKKGNLVELVKSGKLQLSNVVVNGGEVSFCTGREEDYVMVIEGEKAPGERFVGQRELEPYVWTKEDKVMSEDVLFGMPRRESEESFVGQISKGIQFCNYARTDGKEQIHVYRKRLGWYPVVFAIRGGIALFASPTGHWEITTPGECLAEECGPFSNARVTHNNWQNIRMAATRGSLKNIKTEDENWEKIQFND